eukprot:scaffold5432_cov49-Attheya_sp.AAC.2
MRRITGLGYSEEVREVVLAVIKSWILAFESEERGHGMFGPVEKIPIMPIQQSSITLFWACSIQC